METTAARFSAKDMAYIAVFTALLAVCSWIAIPMPWGVAYTLQTLGVFLAVGVLGGKRGTLAVVVYLLLGAMGVPVFSGFQGGTAALLGTTGGYIAGFLFSALVMWMLEKLLGRSLPALALSMVLGLAVCYAFGTAWFLVLYTRSTGPIGLWSVLWSCVLPFVIPDLCKLALALVLRRRLRRALPAG